jgi:hypothetical protein
MPVTLCEWTLFTTEYGLRAYLGITMSSAAPFAPNHLPLFRARDGAKT